MLRLYKLSDGFLDVVAMTHNHDPGASGHSGVSRLNLLLAARSARFYWEFAHFASLGIGLFGVFNLAISATNVVF